MTTYRLVVLPDGHALLTSPWPMSDAEHARLVDGFTRWRSQPPGTTMILPDTEVVQVHDIQLGGLLPTDSGADALAGYTYLDGTPVPATEET